MNGGVGKNGGVGWKGGIGWKRAIGRNGGIEKRRGWINGGIGRGWTGRRRARKRGIKRKEGEKLWKRR